MPSTPVILRAGGLELNDWDALTVTRGLDDFADAFSFTCQSRPELRSRFKPRGYQPAEVWFGDKKIITGKIEKPTATLSTSSLSLEGRSLSGPMIECATKGAVQFGNQTLYQVGRTIAAPFGVNIKAPMAAPSLGPVIVTSSDETAGAFLQRCAQDVGYLWHSDADGNLVIDRPTGIGVPVAKIIEGEGLFIDAVVSVDGTALFSEYTVVMQVGSWPDPKTGTATDSGLPYRPTRRTGATTFREVDQAAKQLRAVTVASATSIDVTLGDWTTDQGLVWEPGQLVELTCPTCWIDRPFALMIAGVTLSLSGQAGRRAVLRLVLPGAYSGELPGRWPWD